MNLLEDVITYLYDKNYDIEIVDNRVRHAELTFDTVTEDTFSNTLWPVKHTKAGTPIMLRDYQVEIVNNFLSNPQSLQEVATGAGKCLSGDTLIQLNIDENTAFGKFILNKLVQEQENVVTRNSK